MAVFNLHQVAELTLNAILLVFTGYKGKTHNLDKLLRYTKAYAIELSLAFADKSAEERHLFDLLRRGYIEARYTEIML